MTKNTIRKYFDHFAIKNQMIITSFTTNSFKDQDSKMVD